MAPALRRRSGALLQGRVRHRQLSVRFNKIASGIVFDLFGLETWLEPFEEAGCKTK